MENERNLRKICRIEINLGKNILRGNISMGIFVDNQKRKKIVEIFIFSQKKFQIFFSLKKIQGCLLFSQEV